MNGFPRNPVRYSVVSNNVAKVCVTVLLIFASLGAWAGTAGIVTHLSGTLIARQADGSGRTLSLNSEVREGETLATQDKTYARIKFADGGEMVLRPNSQLEVSSYAYRPAEPSQDNVAVSLLKGGLRMVTGLLGKRNPDRIGIITPTATVGIRGTHFGLLMCQGDCVGIPTVSGKPPEDGLHLDVAEGAIIVSNSAGQQMYGAGQFGHVRSANSPPALVPATEGIQVTMPPNISQNNSDGRSVGIEGNDSQCTVQ
jgi:hypothetical protein